MADGTPSEIAAHRSPRPLRRLMALLRPDARDLWIVIAFSVAVGVLALAVPITAQMLFNYVAFGALLQPLVVLGVTLFIVLSLAAAMRAVISFVVELLQRRLFVRAVDHLGDRLPRVRADAFDRVSGPEMVNRFFDILTVQKVGATLLLEGVAAFLQTVIGLFIVAFYHPFLLAFSLSLIVVGLFVVFVMGRSAVRTAIAESTAKFAVVAALEEVAHNRDAFKQADAQHLAFRRADALALEYVTARRAHFRVVFRQIIGALAVQVVAASALLMIGGYLVIREQLTLGQLVASELIVAVALASFTKIAEKLGSIYDMFAAVHKLSTLLDLPLERDGGAEHPGGAGGAALSLRGLTFAYPAGVPVFDGFDLEIAPGERVALVGDHGSGKSTLADLLLCARTPTGGRIELDGVDLREISVRSIRRHVAVVRGGETLTGTIAENVSMGRAEVTAKDVRNAMERVGLLESVRALPDGLETRLTPTGAPLSRGQIRRLMLARAIAADVRLLVIDDLLDDLDAPSRERVSAVLADPALGCTVLLLSRSTSPGDIVDRTLPLPSTRGAESAAGESGRGRATA